MMRSSSSTQEQRLKNKLVGMVLLNLVISLKVFLILGWYIVYIYTFFAFYIFPKVFQSRMVKVDKFEIGKVDGFP